MIKPDYPLSVISYNDIKVETEKLTNGLFTVKPANKWIEEAKVRPIPKQLFDVFWFAQELCILFADSNVGKSILAVQIASIISGFEKVLYLDFELSDKQFEARYSENYTNHFSFPDNFLRAELNPDDEFTGFDSFEDYLIHSLEKSIVNTRVKILIIDNITYLKNETDKAKNALPLMKQLKALKKKHDLSILVLSHTPKRNMTLPITQNDLGGSKMIMNFCDSAFAIGASQKDPSLRYLKQIKTRNTELKYGTDYVQVYRIVKPVNRLFMEFMEFGCEREHLKHITDNEREQIISQVKELNEKGLTQREISNKIGIALGTVNKYLKQ